MSEDDNNFDDNFDEEFDEMMRRMMSLATKMGAPSSI